MQNMSRKENCYDNAVIEGFFGIMKPKFIYLEKFEKYIAYYNHKRIKAKPKNMNLAHYRIHALKAA